MLDGVITGQEYAQHDGHVRRVGLCCDVDVTKHSDLDSRAYAQSHGLRRSVLVGEKHPHRKAVLLALVFVCVSWGVG